MVEVGHADFRLAGHLLTAMLLAALSGRPGLNKRQLTLSHGVDEGVVVADVDDDGRKPIKPVTGPCDSNSGY
jgi:hypothetical protein